MTGATPSQGKTGGGATDELEGVGVGKRLPLPSAGRHKGASATQGSKVSRMTEQGWAPGGDQKALWEALRAAVGPDATTREVISWLKGFDPEWGTQARISRTYLGALERELERLAAEHELTLATLNRYLDVATDHRDLLKRQVGYLKRQLAWAPDLLTEALEEGEQA